MKKLVAKYKQFMDAGWGQKQLKELMEKDGLTSTEIDFVITSLFNPKKKK